MEVECPQCHTLVNQGTSYARLLDLTQASQLICHCSQCDITWRPSEAEQAVLATKVRLLFLKKRKK